MSARARIAAVIAAAALAGALAAIVEGGSAGHAPLPVPLAVVWTGHVPSVTLIASTLPPGQTESGKLRFDYAAIPRRIDLGLKPTVVTEVRAFRAGTTEIVAQAHRQCTILRDIWRAEYRVQRDTAHVQRVASRDEVIAQCVDLHSFPVGDEDAWAAVSGHEVVFQVDIDLNPESGVGIARTRKWIGHPDASPGTPPTFYGALVGLFVIRQIANPETSARVESERASRVP